jgi:hypothetical protein
MENVPELKGKIYRIDPTQEIGDKGFKKRSVLVEYVSGQKSDRTFTEIVEFKATFHRCDTLDLYSVGDEVTLGYSLKGRMWKKKDTGQEICISGPELVWIQELNAQIKPDEAQAEDVAGDLFQQVEEDDLPF